MADIEITVDGGTSKRLLTAGKYCDKNILVTATGGGGEDGLKIVSGSFIPAEDSMTYTVAHNLGKIPKIICFFSTNEDLYSMSPPAARFALIADFFTNGNLIICTKKTSGNELKRPSYYGFPDNYYFSSVTESNVIIGSQELNNYYWKINAGEEYFWFAVG